jgi:cobalt-zinc-cadmium resistance protein CzcA
LESLFDQVLYRQELTQIYNELDSLYELFEDAAIRKNELGQGGSLEKMTAQSKRMQLSLQMIDSHRELEFSYAELAKLMRYPESFRIVNPGYKKQILELSDIEDHPMIALKKEMINQSIAFETAEKTKRLPEINVTAFQGFNSFGPFRLFPGVQAGIAIPLSVKSYEAREAAAQKDIEIRKVEVQQSLSELQYNYEQLKSQMNSHSSAIDQWLNTGSALNNNIVVTAKKSLDLGEIDYFQYLLTVESTRVMKLNYLYHLHSYNQTVIAMNNLINL